MYKSLADVLKDVKNESTATLKVFKAITQESLAAKVYDEGRSLGRIAWHITLTLGEMPSKMGLIINAPDENAAIPNTIAEIVDTYERLSNEVISEIQAKFSDATLAELKDFYGEQWTVGEALAVFIRHEIHHRGQLTVLMRQAGCKVPGIYGPSKEEWVAYNMPPME